MTLINYLIISVLIISILFLSILFIKLYKKIKSSDKDSINLINFPSELEKKIENFIINSKKNNDDLIQSLFKNQETTKKIVEELDEKISPFEKVAREKNEELKIYKEGYDYSKNKSIINGIIETIEFIENAEIKIDFKDETLKNYFISSKEKLIIILNNSGIEQFQPNLNSSSLDDHGCEVDLATKKTNDKSKNNLIFSVLKKGYKINLSKNDNKIIKKALVRVYEFEDKDINTN